MGLLETPFFCSFYLIDCDCKLQTIFFPCQSPEGISDFSPALVVAVELMAAQVRQMGSVQRTHLGG